MNNQLTPDVFNERGANTLPGYLGIEILEIAEGRVAARLPVRQQLLAPNGYLHAGSVVTLADTAAGYACMAHLPEGAHSFTTIELKSNHLGTAREGAIAAVATPAHLGRTTQVWDVTVTDEANGKTIALFRCTQMILYPKAG
ncbi:MAG TPA: competence protein ComA [Massilia sp.]|nr:competence protein ComA [Massilia sp.]